MKLFDISTTSLDTRSHKQTYWSLGSIIISRKKSRIL